MWQKTVLNLVCVLGGWTTLQKIIKNVFNELKYWPQKWPVSKCQLHKAEKIRSASLLTQLLVWSEKTTGGRILRNAEITETFVLEGGSNGTVGPCRALWSDLQQSHIRFAGEKLHRLSFMNTFSRRSADNKWLKPDNKKQKLRSSNYNHGNYNFTLPALLFSAVNVPIIAITYKY